MVKGGGGQQEMSRLLAKRKELKGHLEREGGRKHALVWWSKQYKSVTWKRQNFFAEAVDEAAAAAASSKQGAASSKHTEKATREHEDDNQTHAA